jgi:hypothetical protein
METHDEEERERGDARSVLAAPLELILGEHHARF